MICSMTENISNQKSNNVIEIKSIRNARNRTRRTHRQATLIRLEKPIIKERDTIKKKLSGKETGPCQIM